MSDQNPMPEPTREETIARLAAEAAINAMPNYGARLDQLEKALADIKARPAAPDYGDRLDQLEKALADIKAHPAAPDYGDRLDQLEKALAPAPPAVTPELQNLIDDLRLKVATLERNARKCP